VAWFLGYAAQSATKEDAAEALLELPRAGFLPTGQRSAFADEALGRTFLLAGRPAEAVPHLSRAARMCTALDEPFLHVRARLLLGEALAETGEKARACDELGSVVKQWGDAKPSSVTASKAKNEMRALGCNP
jgi:hypothetical protein